MRIDGVRDDVLSKIGVGVVEQAQQDLAVEEVNAHRREEEFAVFGDAASFVETAVHF